MPLDIVAAARGRLYAKCSSDPDGVPADFSAPGYCGRTRQTIEWTDAVVSGPLCLDYGNDASVEPSRCLEMRRVAGFVRREYLGASAKHLVRRTVVSLLSTRTNQDPLVGITWNATEGASIDCVP